MRPSAPGEKSGRAHATAPPLGAPGHLGHPLQDVPVEVGEPRVAKPRVREVEEGVLPDVVLGAGPDILRERRHNFPTLGWANQVGTMPLPNSSTLQPESNITTGKGQLHYFRLADRSVNKLAGRTPNLHLNELLSNFRRNG